MNARKDLEAALRADAGAPTPDPDAAFVDALERRLRSMVPAGVVVPFARRARRATVGAVVATTVVFAGAAAAAGIAVTHPFGDDAPPPVTAPPTTTPATTSVATATTAVAPTTTVAPGTVAPTTVPVTQPPAPTSSPATLPPPTVAPTVPSTAPPAPSPTTVAPATTEVRTPATISLHCAVDGGTVRCTWSPGPTGTVRYAVLRSQPGAGNGRVFFVDPNITSWTDPLATPGATATYLVHAFDGQDRSLAHSTAVSVPCC